MSSAQLVTEQVHNDGLALVREVIDVEAIQGLRLALQKIPENSVTSRQDATYGIRNLFEVCPEVGQLAQNPAVRGLVQRILGPAAFATRGLLFDKVAEADWRVAWHQDTVIAVRDKDEAAGFTAWSKKSGVWHVRPPAVVMSRMLAVRIHLDDSDQANGCLSVIP